MPTLSRTLLSGAAAGLAGSLAMDAVNALWASGSGKPICKVQHGSRPDVAEAQQKVPQRTETATEKAADALTSTVTDRDLSPREKDLGARAVHYSYGIVMGAAYGLLADGRRKPLLHGVGYGLILWAGGILAALPALGLSAPPGRYRKSHHALGILGHLAYGALLGTTYRITR